ncbi:hypothetical protein ACIHFE_12335 [Streptomyces sp. NPDC052396]|uniref:LppU/SCO3897 family protein n=1 Tax=Streptomyces sp. NPDC052396 TaxID=3365689 RepID=UPI0037D17385
MVHHAAVPSPFCEICGGYPATRATVRGHQGLLILMRFRRRTGVFCRTCGTAIHRQLTTQTLWQGWWGPASAFITPVTVLCNVLGPRARFRRLAPPTGNWRPPLDPGKRVLLRPAALAFVVPGALMALVLPTLLIFGLLTGDGLDTKPTRLTVGDCARNNARWPNQNLEAVDCDSPFAHYRVTKNDGICKGYLARLDYSADGTTSLCLNKLR